MCTGLSRTATSRTAGHIVAFTDWTNGVLQHSGVSRLDGPLLQAFQDGTRSEPSLPLAATSHARLSIPCLCHTIRRVALFVNQPQTKSHFPPLSANVPDMPLLCLSRSSVVRQVESTAARPHRHLGQAQLAELTRVAQEG